MPEYQECTVKPWPAEDDDFARAPIQVVQHKRPGAEGLGVFARQPRVSTEENPGMVRVSRPANLRHDHVAALWLVDAVEAGGLVVHLVQAGVVLALPPAVGALESFELKPLLALVPVGADLPAVPGTVDEGALQQWRLAGGYHRPQVALRPAQDVPGHDRRLAHCQVAR